jgi:hypothetical protein
MEGITITAWIAIYAALIATMNVAWSVYKDGFRDRPRLRVGANFMELAGNGRIEHDLIVYRITNTGGKPITLTHVCAKKTGGEHLLIVDDALPKKLEPGDYHLCLWREYEGVAETLAALYVSDSLGREFFAPAKDLRGVNEKLKELAGRGITKSWFG